MGLTYFPAETNQLYLQVLRLSGSVPGFPADYSTPKVRIIHEDSGLQTDLALTSMAQFSDNLWTLAFVIPSTPFFGTYIVEYETTLDSVAIESSETFKVEQPQDIIEQGQGSCQVDAFVQEEGTGDPLPGVTVFVFETNDLNNAIAKDVTDSNGQYTVFLNPGNYKIRFVGGPNFIDETHDLEVFSNCTHVITGD